MKTVFYLLYDDLRYNSQLFVFMTLSLWAMTNTAFTYTISFQCGQWLSTRKRSCSPPDLLLLGGDDAVEHEEAGGGVDAVVDEAGELPGLLR
jgi:hypothetical protein